MDPQCEGNQNLNFGRSLYNSQKTVRTNVNVITAWLDASNIYGSDKDTADSLREFAQGKLRTSVGNMLPKNQQGSY